MKKYLGIILHVMLCTLALQAQQLTKAEMTPVPGDRFLTHRVKNWNSYNPGNIGKNQVWDYSTFTTDFDLDMVYEVIHSAPTPYASAFDTPAICIKWTYAFDQVVLNYSFFKNTTNSLINLGYINSLGKVKYTDPDTTFSFPITFNQVISDSFAYYREADTLYQSFAGTNKVAIDAEGTLKLPGKTYENVLRVKSDLTYLDSAKQDTVHIIRYFWYKAGIHRPLMEYYTIFTDTNIMKEIYFTEVTAVPVSVEPQSFFHYEVFPNPAGNMVQVNGLDGKESKVTIHNVTGQVYIQETTNSETLILPVGDLPPGIYFMRIVTSEQSYSVKLVKK